MTSSEKNIVKSLVAVAWADGRIERPEAGVLEGLLCGFDATEDEEQEILEWAKQPRTLGNDAPLDQLTREDREILLANAALMTHADGQQDEAEHALLERLVVLLGFERSHAAQIIASACENVRHARSNSVLV